MKRIKARALTSNNEKMSPLFLTLGHSERSEEP